MPKTISAVAVVTSLLAGSNMAGNQLTLDLTATDSPIYLESFTSGGISGWLTSGAPPVAPGTGPLETVAGGTHQDLVFTAIEPREGAFTLSAIYSIESQPFTVEMSLHSCTVEGETGKDVPFSAGQKHFNLRADGGGYGNANAVACVISISGREQGVNDFSISLAQDVPAGITLQGTPTYTGIVGGGTDVLPSTLGAGETSQGQFKTEDINGQFTIGATYMVSGTNARFTIAADLNKCTVNGSSDETAPVFGANGQYYKATIISQLGAPNEFACSVAIQAAENVQNQFGFNLSGDMPTMDLQAGAVHENLEAGKTLPAHLVPGENVLSFSSTQENGSFKIEGTYAINDGGANNKVPVLMLKDDQGNVTCSVKGSSSQVAFDTGSNPNGTQFYSATVNPNKSVPEEATCDIQFNKEIAPSVTNAVVNIKNQ